MVQGHRYVLEHRRRVDAYLVGRPVAVAELDGRVVAPAHEVAVDGVGHGLIGVRSGYVAGVGQVAPHGVADGRVPAGVQPGQDHVAANRDVGVVAVFGQAEV